MKISKKNNGNNYNINNSIILPDIKKSKICILYCYYERINEKKNQTNLNFFIKYGLNKKNWLNLNITTLIIVNNHICEVDLLSNENIFILKEDNCLDFEGWYNGIKFFENKFNKKFYDIFDYLFIFNCSTFGPIYEENINYHWILPFYQKMVETNSVACCPYINNWYKDFFVDKGLSPHATLLYINNNIYDLLINKIHTINNLSNTVFGKKHDKIDAIVTGEHLLSYALIKNMYNICNIYPLFVNKYINDNDREEFFHKNNDFLKETIFIKNIWRIEQGHASLSVLYDYCIEYMHNKLKINNIYDKLNIDYDNLYITNNKNLTHFTVNNNEDYYNKIGRAEELITFPKKNICDKSCIYLLYIDNIPEYILHNIRILILNNYDIHLFINTKINNLYVKNLPVKIYNYNNYDNINNIIVNNLRNELFNNILFLSDVCIFTNFNLNYLINNNSYDDNSIQITKNILYTINNFISLTDIINNVTNKVRQQNTININNCINNNNLNDNIKYVLRYNNLIEKNNNTICIIACHLKDELTENILLHNLKYFAEISDKIIILDSDDFINNNFYNKIKNKYNDTINFEIYYYKNTKFLCQGKWAEYLNYNNVIDKYKNYILTNDSFLIIKSLSNFKNLFDVNIEMTTLITSNEGKFHYPDFLRRYNNIGIEKLLNYYNDDNIKNNIYTYNDIIINYEINSKNIFNNVNSFLKSPDDFNGNIHFYDDYTEDYLCNKNYPVIKNKKLMYTFYENNILPSDFNVYEYKNLYSDLAHIDNESILSNHFLKYGMIEGRPYKKNQIKNRKKYLQDYLNKLNLEFAF